MKEGFIWATVFSLGQSYCQETCHLTSGLHILSSEGLKVVAENRTI